MMTASNHNSNCVHSRTTNIVIAALGGEGGGTLVSWIEDVAYNAGWYAQATSIAGVAQRTGATIYYIELFAGRGTSRAPIMSTFPAPGDIDIAISSEIAEAGRLIQRGFCSKDRTTLITSDHHVFGITEKVTLGDGRANTKKISAVAAQQCKRLVSFDMLELANTHNTVISATLFGALAGAKALPFTKTDYEAVISSSGKMVESNLAAFNASYNRAIAPQLVVESTNSSTPLANAQVDDAITQSQLATEKADFRLPKATTIAGKQLLARIENNFPESCYEFLTHGVERLLDYQDLDYAEQYLDELEQILAADNGRQAHTLSRETARHLALWMCFEDTARVAQIKTREARNNKIRAEVQAEDDQILHITEFFAPRLEEICQPLPAALARAIIASPMCRKLAAPLTKGKRLRTDTITTFSLLRMMAFTRKWRRRHYSFQHEHSQIQQWLEMIKRYTKEGNIDAATELVKSATMVKGYGKTRERGSKQMQQLLDVCAARSMTADMIKKLRTAALADDSNEAFAELMTDHELMTV